MQHSFWFIYLAVARI